MKHQVVLTEVSRWLIPFVIVYGVYVQTHGELGPGGGFQAGVILASAYILYALLYGTPEAQRRLPRWITDALASVGVLIYSGVGVLCWLLGGGLLDYHRLLPDHAAAQALGMTLVELGVGTTVCCVMVTIYNEIAVPPGQADAEPGAP